MSDSIASVDAGNGGIKAVLAKSSGGHKSHYEPSVRASVQGTASASVRIGNCNMIMSIGMVIAM